MNAPQRRAAAGAARETAERTERLVVSAQEVHFMPLACERRGEVEAEAVDVRLERPVAQGP